MNWPTAILGHSPLDDGIARDRICRPILTFPKIKNLPKTRRNTVGLDVECMLPALGDCEIYRASYATCSPRAVCLRRCLCVQVVAEIDVGVRMAQSVDRRAIGIARYLRTWRTSHETHRCAAVRSPLHQQLRLDVRAPRNAELV